MKKWLYCEYPVRVTWSDYTEGEHRCSWLLISTMVIDDYLIEKEGCDSREVEIEHFIGFGKAASGIDIQITYRSEINPHERMIRDVDK